MSLGRHCKDLLNLFFFDLLNLFFFQISKNVQHLDKGNGLKCEFTRDYSAMII